MAKEKKEKEKEKDPDEDGKAAAKAEAKAAKASDKEAAKAVRREQRVKRKAAKLTRKRRSRAAWNTSLSDDGSYLFIVNLLVIFIAISFCLSVSYFFWTHNKIPDSNSNEIISSHNVVH